MDRVTRVDLADQPSIRSFAVDRSGRDPLLVLWDQRDPFDGENEPPVTVRLPWSAPGATAIDALGAAQGVRLDGDHLRLAVSVTPVFLAPAGVPGPDSTLSAGSQHRE